MCLFSAQRVFCAAEMIRLWVHKLINHLGLGNRKLYMFYFKNQFLILVINIPATRRVKGHITVHCRRREIGNR